MDDPAPPVARKPRADTVRNRERLLAAAKAVFSAGGVVASLESVAREACVGIGTLYRHFPTREALFEAVYRREVEQLAAYADELAAGPAPAEALRRWLHALVELVATKKGMSAALAVALQSGSDLAVYSTGRFTEALRGLLQRAAETGEVRADVGPEDLLRTVVGLCYMYETPGWQENVVRMLDVFLDGMRVRDAEARPGRSCRESRMEPGGAG